MSALELSQVCVAYGRRVAVQGVDGRLGDGEVLGLLGPNGAGKSTLLRAVLGLVPLSSGAVTVLGTTPAAARRDVAYVPQADVLDPDFPVSVRQVVLMGRYRRVGWLRRPGARDRALADAALEAVGLDDRADERFGTLSGGQRQRVLLARAIAQQPRLYLLDEPFNGVDSTSEQLLLEALEAQRAAGAAVVLSTHDLGLAREVCDVVCLLDRRQIAFGPVQQALTPQWLSAAYGSRAQAVAL